MRTRVMGVLLAVVALLGTAPALMRAQDKPPVKLPVAVSILPQAYFVERVGGQYVDIEVLVGPGQSPHAYEPTPRQLEALSRARAYFIVGIDFETALLPRIERVFKDLKIVDTRAGIPLRSMTADEAQAEASHAEHGEQGHEASGSDHHAGRRAGRLDPHIWLSPPLVKIQAHTICDTLVELDPAHAEAYRKNLAAFDADLDRVHAQLAATLASLKGQAIFVFHPAFGYFTDTYGLKQVPVEIEGKEPTAKQLVTLIERAKTDGVKVIFVQPQFSKKSAEAVAQAIGGAVVPLDDLSRDYLMNLDDMAAKIKAALHKE